MTPRSYTELFFLDEATALAAGHRPCAECRRADYNSFQAAWQRAGLPPPARADAMDRLLHAERTQPGHEFVTPVDLPNGVMVAQAKTAYLVNNSRLYRWSFQGYSQAPEVSAPLRLLTPPAVTKILAAGFTPGIHRSGR